MSRYFFLILLCFPFLTAGACSLNVEKGVNFGVYDPISTKPNKSVGTVEVICTQANAPAFSISLDPGMSGNYSQRTLVSGKSKLKYNLYLNPAYVSVWGNGTANTASVSGLGSNCANGCQFNVYAQIPARQRSAGVGSYSDTIIANISF